MMSGLTTLAIIGGSGMSGMSDLQTQEPLLMQTPYGTPSANLRQGCLNGLPAIYLARHGKPHALAPHLINYRANMWALRERGATHVLAINAVGGITPAAVPGSLFAPHQLIDYTWGRESSFHDGVSEPLRHQEFCEPYDASMRGVLRAAAAQCAIELQDSAVYGCTQGPRLETAAEITRMQRDGCDLVGMTGMPEAALAAELGLRYASLAMVVNWAAGKSQEAITLQDIERVAATCMVRIVQLTLTCAGLLAGQGSAPQLPG